MTRVASKADPDYASSPAVARVTVNLPARVWDELGRIANESQISRTEALRQAINTEVVLRKVRSEGADVCIRRPDGTLERMVFTY
jgi:hypothetical protein